MTATDELRRMLDELRKLDAIVDSMDGGDE